MPLTRAADTPLETAGPAVLVWLTPVSPKEDASQHLAALFGLTRAEARLSARLIAGDALADAAAVLHVSVHTARTQLKAILRKTGRRNQSQLLMLATRIGAFRCSRASFESA
jgi:DNA-binding CsgD family transcriptional regulator